MGRVSSKLTVTCHFDIGQARVNEEDGNEKRAAMSGKVQKMKEDITREATLRVSAMHDREEQAALKAAAVALVSLPFSTFLRPCRDRTSTSS